MTVANPQVALSSLPVGAAFQRSDGLLYIVLSLGGGNTFTGTAPATSPCAQVGSGWFGGINPAEMVTPRPDANVVF